MRIIRRLFRTVLTLAVFAGGLWAVITQPFTLPSNISLSIEADASRLERHVRMLAAELAQRSDDAAALEVSRDYIFEQLSHYGEPQLQTFDVKGIEYSNVVLKLGSERQPPIVVGAHYDSYNGLPGADDNASGVAGLLELARLISESNNRLDVELVAFALEEPPYFHTQDMGSAHHAASTSGDVELMICLEMIGYFRDAPGSQTYPLRWLKHLYSSRGDFIAIVGRLSEISAVRTIKSAFSATVDLPTRSLNFLPIVPGMGLSDHSSYWARDINAVMITDTAFQRNPNYHTLDDTPDTLDYSRMANVVTGTFAALLALSD